MKKAIVKSIGKNAIDSKDSMLILFGDTATDALRDVSVIQQLENNHYPELTVHDQLAFDDQVYTIDKVGRLANENLISLGHVTVMFQAAPKDDEGLLNALYVSPHVMPVIKEGTIITYK